MVSSSFCLPAIFITSTTITLLFLWGAIRYVNQKVALLVLLSLVLWISIEGILALNHFFLNFHSFPPRLIFAIGPPLILIIFLFTVKKSRLFLTSISLVWLTWLHIVRIPVEIGLLLLYREGLVPELMTFEGINWDILSGLTAPIIAYGYFHKKYIHKSVVIVWNIIALCLLINIVGHAILTSPFVGALAHDQPNIGVLYFPIIWLPCFIVPAVLFSHITAFVQLTEKTILK